MQVFKDKILNDAIFTYRQQPTRLPTVTNFNINKGDVQNSVHITSDSSTLYIRPDINTSFMSLRQAIFNHLTITNEDDSGNGNGQFTLVKTLSSPNAIANGGFGTVINISEDGNRVIIGAVDAGFTTNGENAVYIFVRNGNDWVIEADSSLGSGNYGFSVALNNDASIAVIGSPLENQGAVYVLERTGSNWAIQLGGALISPNGVANGAYGSSVSINGDGDRIAVGAYGEQTGFFSTTSGRAYVYIRSGGAWNLEASLVSDNPELSGAFGRSIAINTLGDRVIVGAINEDSAQADSGTVYIFSRTDVTWSLESTLIPTIDVEENFGISVAINSVGDKAVVGQSHFDGVALQGRVYVYSRSGTTWSEEQVLSSDSPNELYNFGVSVDINTLGDKIIVGASNEQVNTITGAGATYIFTSVLGTWNQEQKLTSANAETNGRYGQATTIDGDGDTIAVGASEEDNTEGRVYIYNTA